MKKFMFGIILTQVFTAVHAGFIELTEHSRANCVNNESITWQAGHSYLLYTASRHYIKGKLIHHFTTGWEYTWRSAAVHWGEGTGGWYVQGDHLILIDHQIILLKETGTEDCSIYDGWWD